MIYIIQSLGRMIDPKLKIDGVFGPKTKSALHRLLKHPIKRRIVEQYVEQTDLSMADVERFLTDRGDQPPAQLVVALSSALAARGLMRLKPFILAQWHLESAAFKSALAVRHKNYAGLKTNVLKGSPFSYKSVTMKTEEYEDGVMRKISAGFASFATYGDFVENYLWYLFDGPSAYRYVGLSDVVNVREYAYVLRRGGYATDPNYVRNVASRYVFA